MLRTKLAAAAAHWNRRNQWDGDGACEKTFQGTTTPTPAQLELFDALSLPKPAR